MKRCAVVWTTGWAGDIAYRVFVVGETPTKYIVTPAVSRFRRPGGEKWLEMGETMRPPKYAVAFYPKWKGAPHHAKGRLPSDAPATKRLPPKQVEMLELLIRYPDYTYVTGLPTLRALHFMALAEQRPGFERQWRITHKGVACLKQNGHYPIHIDLADVRDPRVAPPPTVVREAFKRQPVAS